jgi:hypothetical protein
MHLRDTRLILIGAAVLLSLGMGSPELVCPAPVAHDLR